MNVSKEIKVITNLLGITQEELAKRIGFSFEIINQWEKGKIDADETNVEKIYSFAFNNGIFLNEIYEQLLVEEYQKENTKVLFHGCKTKIDTPIDFLHSKANNDFGKGFYLGESFKQAAIYIANSSSKKVYAFSLELEDLDVSSFSVTKEWMIAIAFYRGWIDKWKESKIVSRIVGKIEQSDVIIAPIADNRMFDIISEFVRGEITDVQCEHALAATNLGRQYVLRTEKALSRLYLVRESFLSLPEKMDCVKIRKNMTELGQNKVKVVRIEYRGQGQYIDEILK